MTFDSEKLFRNTRVAHTSKPEDHYLEVSKVIDFSEPILNYSFQSLIDDPALNSFPLIGTIIKSLGLASNIRDNIFAKKVKRFLLEADKIKSKERDSFEKKHSKRHQDLYDTIINIIDKCEESEKIEWISKVFVSCVRQEIEVDQCLRICLSISRAFSTDLEKIPQLSHPKGIDEIESAEALASVGLALKRTEINNGNLIETYELGKYGKIFEEIIF